MSKKKILVAGGGGFIGGHLVSRLLAENEHFRMHEELGTGPNLFYLWDAKAEHPAPETEGVRE